MKQIAQTLSRKEAHQLKIRIEGAGIPVAISGDGASYRFRNGVVSVWVAISSQYNDALLALERPGHVAENPVNVEEFHRSVRQQSLLPAFFSKINYPALFTYLFISVFVIAVLRALATA